MKESWAQGRYRPILTGKHHNIPRPVSSAMSMNEHLRLISCGREERPFTAPLLCSQTSASVVDALEAHIEHRFHALGFVIVAVEMLPCVLVAILEGFFKLVCQTLGLLVVAVYNLSATSSASSRRALSCAFFSQTSICVI